MSETHYLERIKTYVGADGRQLRWQVKDEDGNAYDLSGITSATISARLGSLNGANTDWKIKAQTVTIEGGTDGWINYTPTAAEIDVEGEYKAQVRTLTGAAVGYFEPSIIEVGTASHYVAP